MRKIGITGGVGAGKSQILQYLREHYSCKIILADEVAHRVKMPGQECYNQLVEYLGEEIVDKDGRINTSKMAERIFNQKEVLKEVNRIIHPAVKRVILKEIEDEERKGEIDYLFLEAALLLEEKYDEILDEIWYIHASEEIRKQRLMISRGYTIEKISTIMSHQMTEVEFRKRCAFEIDNSKELENTFQQIQAKLGECK